MYSQQDEEYYITQYFNGSVGTFIDLGAFDGINLSNTRRLMELGWGGVCVEPHPITFNNLEHNCSQFQSVLCYQFAMADKNDTVAFYVNDTYYSTIKEDELSKWAGVHSFSKSQVNTQTFEHFMSYSPYKTFDFISIDCEGVDYEILSQINLKEVGCKLICVETNNVNTEKYIAYISQFENFSVIARNNINLIMGIIN